MKRKLSPLVQAIALYNSLDDRDKVTLSEYIKSQTASTRAPKSTTVPSAAKKSKEKKGSTEGATGSATTVAVCAVPVGDHACGLPEESRVHDSEYENYHVFHTTIKKRGAKEGIVLPDNPEGFLSKGSAA